MLYSNAKAIALLRDLGSKLAERLALSSGINTVSAQSFYTDSNGAIWPLITLTNASDGAGEGEPVILIQISGQDAISKDVFGNELYSYAPHIMKFAYELTSGGAPIPAVADLILAEWEAMRVGVRFQLIQIAHGTAVTATSVNAATPAADIDSLYWPTKLV